MSCTHVTKRRFSGPIFLAVAGLEGSGHHGLCAAVLAQCAVRRSVQLEHAIQALVYATPDDFSNATHAVVDLLRDIGATAPADTLVTMQCTPSWMMSWPEERWALRNGGMRAVWRDQLNNNIRAHRKGADLRLEGKVTAHADVRLLASTCRATVARTAAAPPRGGIL